MNPLRNVTNYLRRAGLALLSGLSFAAAAQTAPTAPNIDPDAQHDIGAQVVTETITSPAGTIAQGPIIRTGNANDTVITAAVGQNSITGPIILNGENDALPPGMHRVEFVTMSVGGFEYRVRRLDDGQIELTHGNEDNQVADIVGNPQAIYTGIQPAQQKTAPVDRILFTVSADGQFTTNYAVMGGFGAQRKKVVFAGGGFNAFVPTMPAADKLDNFSTAVVANAGTRVTLMEKLTEGFLWRFAPAGWNLPRPVDAEIAITRPIVIERGNNFNGATLGWKVGAYVEPAPEPVAVAAPVIAAAPAPVAAPPPPPAVECPSCDGAVVKSVAAVGEYDVATMVRTGTGRGGMAKFVLPGNKAGVVNVEITAKGSERLVLTVPQNTSAQEIEAARAKVVPAYTAFGTAYNIKTAGAYDYRATRIVYDKDGSLKALMTHVDCGTLVTPSKVVRKPSARPHTVLPKPKVQASPAPRQPYVLKRAAPAEPICVPGKPEPAKISSAPVRPKLVASYTAGHNNLHQKHYG